jgi:RNA polymerase sigma-70 factor (ECF subfamily)
VTHPDDLSTLGSLTLLARARAGDQDALDALLARVRPRLERWATGRLPSWARDVADTDDLLQDTLVSAVRNLDTFNPQHETAFSVYLRQTFMNRVRDEMRRAGRRPGHDALDEAAELPSSDRSPLSNLVEQHDLARYEACLARLSPVEREAIIGRLELKYSFQDLADAWGKPSADAARKFVERTIVRLAVLMKGDD